MTKEDLADQRIDELCEHFKDYVKTAIDRYGVDTPARHFHIRTIQRLTSVRSFSEIFDDELFYDYLYATLVSWGMSGRSAKLLGFDGFKHTLQSNRNNIIELSEYSLRLLADADDSNSKVQDDLVRLIIQVFSNVSVSATESKLVANSKALHHVLPNLIPPVDRNYTLRFFYDNKRVKKGNACISQFIDVLGYFEEIYFLLRDEVETLVQANSFNSSVTKVIDNAIIGYCIENLPKQQTGDNLE